MDLRGNGYQWLLVHQRWLLASSWLLVAKINLKKMMLFKLFYFAFGFMKKLHWRRNPIPDSSSRSIWQATFIFHTPWFLANNISVYYFTNRKFLKSEIEEMVFTALFFNFIFHRNTSSLVFQLDQNDCINYCSSFLISVLPSVDDTPCIKKTKTALLLANEFRIKIESFNGHFRSLNMSHFLTQFNKKLLP